MVQVQGQGGHLAALIWTVPHVQFAASPAALADDDSSWPLSTPSDNGDDEYDYNSDEEDDNDRNMNVKNDIKPVFNVSDESDGDIFPNEDRRWTMNFVIAENHFHILVIRLEFVSVQLLV